ncbi:hypothetical protein EMN47_12070 [Prolixibacteraceae bacterium JC049]|nr:hypothetical protein [Prolixibacteraceae bacterium JC049]
MKNSTTLQFIHFLFILTFVPQVVLAQTLSNSTENLKVLSTINTEKVHLHLDRRIFSPGEDLWYSAYLVDGTFHHLTSTSNNLHVELIAPDGSIVLSQVALIYNGTGHGDFKLDNNSIKDGIYRIRAYTNHMRNFDDAIFFEEEILITSNQEKEKQTAEAQKELSLQFFPEGGNLVYGVINRVAFHITNQFGKGEKATVTIFDQTDKRIIKTKTIHNGMGKFVFKPERYKTYYALFSTPEFTSEKVELPKSEMNYSIFVGRQFSSELDFHICTSPDNVKHQQVSYIIQTRGKLFSSNSISIDSPQTVVRINKNDMPSGISCITIFDENEVAVAERLIYNQIRPELNISVKTNKTNYKNREKVTLEIETKNKAGKPVAATLSMAIVANNIIDTQNRMLNQPSNIQASILLNADLKGHIENPAYYFTNFNKTKHAKLDLALLTHGWRKYIWKEKLTEPQLKMDYAFENGFTFTGTAKTLVFNRPIEKGKVSLVMNERAFYYKETKTDENGKFEFKNIHLEDTTLVLFQAYNKRDKRKSNIYMDSCFYASAVTSPIDLQYHFKPDNSLNSITAHTQEMLLLKDSLELKNNRWLDEVIIKAEKKEKDNHFRYYSKADVVIEVGKEHIAYNNIFEIIQGRVPGVRIIGSCPDVEIVIRGAKIMASTKNSANPSVCLLDGAFVEINEMCNIHPSQVDKIEILKGAKAAIYGSRGMDGIIAVYTKGVDSPLEKWEHIDIGIVRKKQPGYYRTREFYSPNYDEDQTKFESADYRNTLYWNPQIITDKKGKAKVSFFTSDESGSYQVTTEGIGVYDESMGTKVSTFEVR